jgi:hypothetical protein
MSSAGQAAGDSLMDASSASQRVTANIVNGTADKDVRDRFLLGAAALAITAAIGIASQRQSQQER